MHIRNPVEWGVDQVRLTGSALGRTMDHRHKAVVPETRRISLSDTRHALARGVDDFGAFRSDVVFLAIIYPLVGLVLARLIFGYGMLPLLFPLASGFALIGPVAAVGLYEMSRRREASVPAGWPMRSRSSARRDSVQFCCLGCYCWRSSRCGSASQARSMT